MNLRTVRRAMSVFLLVSLSSGLVGAEWHVAPAPLGNNSNPGTNELPFATIQHGIDASSDGDTVIVAEGTYQENIQFKGKNIILTSTDPLDSAVVAGTIIDGNQTGSVVTFFGTETETCVLSGFTIRNGQSGGSGGGICGGLWDPRTHATIQLNTITRNSARWGGGLFNCGGMIQNNTITGNSAGEDGGGLAGCDGTIQNNTIVGNLSGCAGGGLDFCGGMIQNNMITANSALWYGGGLCYCNGTIRNNTIGGNSAKEGGGLWVCEGTIQNNAITDNSAGYGGGGLWWCRGMIQNNTITDNSAQDNGGGLYNCNGTIQNNIIAGNSVFYSGGGLYQCNGTIWNNTITGNSAAEGGGLYCCDGTTQNCVIWGNTALISGPQLYTTSIPTYSCIQWWSGGGEGNISENPLLVDPDGPDNDPATQGDNDYRLSAGSPCIDAGRNEHWMWGAKDLDGNVRVYPGGKSLTVDMGAYEYGSWPFRITAVLMEPTGGFQLSWNSRPGDEYVIWWSWIDLTWGIWEQGPRVPSGGDSTCWTDPSPSGLQKLYRVQQL